MPTTVHDTLGPMNTHGESMPLMQSAPGPETIIDGRPYLYFGGTGYLGLAGHPEVIEAGCSAIRRYGLHTATSRNGFGNSPPLLDVEHQAAKYFGMEDAFYFASGYVTNHILVEALAEHFDFICLATQTHYCAEEAARITGKPVYRFAHGSPAGLAEVLKQNCIPTKRPLIMTDGISPVTGELAPLPAYLKVMEPYAPATLLVDDAHGFGVLGAQGRGSFEHFELWTSGVNRLDPSVKTQLVTGGTLSKAMGGFGGIIFGPHNFVQKARSSSNYYAGASAPPAPVAAATAKAIEIARQDPSLRQRLTHNIQTLRQSLRALGLQFPDSPAANLGVQVGDAANMQRIHDKLKHAGILVPFMRNYTGIGTEGLLRVAVCALHTDEMLNRLLSELRKVL